MFSMLSTITTLSAAKPRTAILTWQRYAQVAGVLWMIALAVLTALPQSPSMIPQGRDSGIYAYTSEQVYDGATLYRDVWIDKPPVIFGIDSLAFTLFGPTRWALWLIGIGIHLATLAIVYALLMAIYRRPALALTGVLIFAVMARHPAMVVDANMTEVYALLPQAVFLGLGYWFLHKPSYPVAVLMGLVACAALMTRQTSIGMALMFVPAVVSSYHPVMRDPRRWRWLGVIIFGGLAGMAGVAYYLWMNHALEVALEAVVLFPSQFHDWANGTYIPFWTTPYTTLKSGNFWMVVGPYALFVALGVAQAGRHLLAQFQQDRAPVSRAIATRHAWEIWIVMTFITDVGLTNLTNKSYAHYFVTPMLSMTLIVVAVLAALFESPRRAWRFRLLRYGLWFEALLVVVLIQVLALMLVDRLPGSDADGPALRTPLASYVVEHTAPTDYVLAWGADSSMITFQAGRQNPMRYHFGYPLVVPGDITQQRIAQAVDDLLRNQPVLVVDTAWTDGNRVPPLDPMRRIEWWAIRGGHRDGANLQPIYDFVAEYCTRIDRIDQGDIYRCEY